MNKTKYTLCLALALIVTMFNACKNEDIAGYKADPAVNFTAASGDYSFITNPDNEYVQQIEVRVMGNAADHDRQFSAAVVKDSLTTATDDQYSIVGGLVKANELTGMLSVKIKNSADLSTKKVTVKLQLVNSADFKAGNIESQLYVLGWTNQILVPNPWSYFQYFFTSKASTSAYRIILQTTGLTRFNAADYRALGSDGTLTLATKFGDYVKQWNLDHPDDHLKHDDGVLAGQEIVPLYYTHSKYD